MKKSNPELKRVIKVQEYINQLKDLLGLRDWCVQFLNIPVTEDDIDAQIVIIEPYRLGRIQVCVGFFDYSPHRQRHVLVHELCHIYTERLMDMVNNIPHQHKEDISAANEYAVECAARIIAAFVPLPKGL